MTKSLDTLIQLLQVEDSPMHNEERERLWDHIDLNKLGFVSLDNIVETLCEVSDIEVSADFRSLVGKALKDVRWKSHLKCPYGQDYIRKSEFRLFSKNLRRHLMNLEMFRSIDTNNDSLIHEKELVFLVDTIVKGDLGRELISLAKQLFPHRNITFNMFEELLETCESRYPKERSTV